MCIHVYQNYKILLFELNCIANVVCLVSSFDKEYCENLLIIEKERRKERKRIN